MTDQINSSGNFKKVLTVLSLVSLLYILPAIILNKEQVFIDKDTFALSEFFLLCGFGILFLFIISSVIWKLNNARRSKVFTFRDMLTIIFGALCILLLFGEKVMLDEIGREYALGWETTGEWIILYLFLSIHLLYNIIVAFQVFNVRYIQVKKKQMKTISYD